jgi:hypothetical protein
MNLLSHHNINMVARFQRSTFAFLPPDHWASSWGGGPRAGTANWQVMVIEISNKKGRDKYKVGHEDLIAEAGRSFGAKLVSNQSINTRKHHWNKFSAPSKQFLNTPKFYRTTGMYTHPPPDTNLTQYTSDTARRFPAGGRIFNDGSLIDRKGVGASYYDEHTQQTTYIRVDQKDILRAELTATLRVVQDRVADPEPLQIFTDSLTALTHLNLSCCNKVTDNGLGALVGLTALKAALKAAIKAKYSRVSLDLRAGPLRPFGGTAY